MGAGRAGARCEGAVGGAEGVLGSDKGGAEPGTRWRRAAARNRRAARSVAGGRGGRAGTGVLAAPAERAPCVRACVRLPRGPRLGARRVGLTGGLGSTDVSARALTDRCCCGAAGDATETRCCAAPAEAAQRRAAACWGSLHGSGPGNEVLEPPATPRACFIPNGRPREAFDAPVDLRSGYLGNPLNMLARCNRLS
jgi:hypothetical protein